MDCYGLVYIGLYIYRFGNMGPKFSESTDRVAFLHYCLQLT